MLTFTAGAVVVHVAWQGDSVVRMVVVMCQVVIMCHLHNSFVPPSVLSLNFFKLMEEMLLSFQNANFLSVGEKIEKGEEQ